MVGSDCCFCWGSSPLVLFLWYKWFSWISWSLDWCAVAVTLFLLCCNVLNLALLHSRTNEYYFLFASIRWDYGPRFCVGEGGMKMRWKGKRMNQEQVVVPMSHDQCVGARGWRFVTVTLDAAVGSLLWRILLDRLCSQDVICQYFFNQCWCLLKS